MMLQLGQKKNDTHPWVIELKPKLTAKRSYQFSVDSSDLLQEWLLTMTHIYNFQPI